MGDRWLSGPAGTQGGRRSVVKEKSTIYIQLGDRKVSKLTHFQATKSLLLGAMERQRNQFRRLHDRFWGTKWSSSTAPDSPVWVLGVCYKLSSSSGEGGDEATATPQDVNEFLQDFSSRIWLTYRRGFEALGPAKLTSDVGWGCMLRSGQMLLAQAMVCHYLKREWRRDQEQPHEQKYLEILQSFGDSLDESSPFSIHNILEAGNPYGVVAGSWLGPYALCRTIEALAIRDTQSWEKGTRKRALPMAVCVVSGDAEGERGGAPVLCIEDVAELCTDWDKGTAKWAPLLLLVPLVLGVDKVNPRYLPSLRATFCFPQSLGIAGGKPGASTYLVGIQDDQALYLDPHEVQQVVRTSPDDAVKVDTSSYHCSVVRRMALEAIDPSLALGFYCRDKAEFEDLCTRSSELAKESNGAPMFTVAQSRSRKLTSEMSFGKLRLDGQDSTSGDTENVDVASTSEDDWQIL
ncbi:unnamed protein product [Calypogeia fissa]